MLSPCLQVRLYSCHGVLQHQTCHGVLQSKRYVHVLQHPMLAEMQLVLPGALYINIFAWYFSDFGQTTRGCPWIAALLSASFFISFAGIPSFLSLFFMNNCQSKFGLCIFFLLQLKGLQLSMKWPKTSKNESKVIQIIQNNKYF